MNIIYNGIVPLFSAFIGGFISLWIFKKGVEKQKQKERERRILNNYETEEYFKINIDSIIIFLDYQIDIILNLSQKMKDMKVRNLSVQILAELKLTELRELNFKTLYQIFVIDREGVNKNKSNDFINIKNCLHNIDDFVTTQQNDNIEISRSLNKESENWNDGLKNLSQLYNKFHNESSDQKDELLHLLHSYIVIKQHKIKASGEAQDLEVVYHELILPLIQDIIKSRNKQDIRIHVILDNLILCRKAYEMISELRYQRRRSVLLSGRNLSGIKSLLSESLDSLTKRKKRIE